MSGPENNPDNQTASRRTGRSRPAQTHTPHQYYIILAGLLLIVAVCTVLLGMAFKQDRLIRDQVKEKADALFEGIVLLRQWNADYGGVYVLKGPDDVSNPYLKDPDITDTDGNVYTKKNPALMTREVSAYAEKSDKLRFHITSLNLLNPDNKPDDWERRALKGFEKGMPEFMEVTTASNGEHLFRLMKPLFVTESCLSCHVEKGFAVGEARGGISVTLPFNDAFHALKANFYGMVAIAVVLAVVFAGVLYLFVWRLMGRMEEQQKELTRLNAAKDRFMRVAAHDLRNPLVVINGYADLLKEDMTDPGHIDLIKTIRLNSDKMVRLINNLLDVSKIQNGSMSITIDDVDVGSFIRECYKANEFVGRTKGIALETIYPKEETRARFDRHLMHQAIDNLLANAFKFSNNGQVVTLGAKAEDGRLIIWVADRGAGIDKEEWEDIFEEFHKGSTRPTGGEGGTGLGLAIVRHIVEQHDGTVEVESAPGEGATFTITIPLLGPVGSVR